MKAKFVIALGGLLSLGTAAAITVYKEEKSVKPVPAVEKVRPPTETGSDYGSLKLTSINRLPARHIQSNDMFGSKSWYEQPQPDVPAKVEPEPVQAPMAPALPLKFIGRMIDDSEIVIFLSWNGKQYTVKKNDTLENTYRIDDITQTEVSITHLPTNTVQTLAFNSSANVTTQ